MPVDRNRRASQRIALVMIARDEASRIGRALTSARPWVDDCVVLDTGSRDDTMNVARAAGARVQSFRWVDDFAAARNAALDIAGADWHLILDADEWIESGGEAIAALRGQRPEFVAQLRVDSLQETGGVRSAAPSWISRVLPGRVRYAGNVHEQPVHRLPVRRLAVSIGHDGYLADALAAKAGRNAALLQGALSRSPRDAYLWYQLGKDHDVYGRHAQALDCLDRAAALMPSPPPDWAHDLTVRSLHALKRCKRHADAVPRAEVAMAAWPDSPDVFFALGDLLLDWAADEPTRAGELLPMIEAAWTRCLEIGERPDLEGAVGGRGSNLAAHNLALLYETFSQPAQAARYRAVADAGPRAG
ncbi:MAG: hypothetical protein ABT20_06640 [Rubrivivax sp. SCN 70-15]|nr:MAG: hypothetical protein ABT20_06640 [Rubrivivax sp. SCN 70-15]